MKKIMPLAVLFTLVFATGAIAQNVNTDSLSLVSKIGDNQLKLGKLQNEVDQRTKDKKDAANRAQNSANDNAAAAQKLSDNPDNRKLARNADNTAGDAKADARSARKDARRLATLNDNIADVKNKINKDQAKLDKFTGNTTPPIN